MNSTEVLLDCLSFAEDPERRGRLGQVTEDVWYDVLDKCDYHRTGPYVYHRLKAWNVPLPIEVDHALKQKFFKAVYRSENLYFCLGAILSEFAKQGIPVVLLKGAYLAEAVYAERALRHMSDLDLLVKKEDLDSSTQALMSIGYQLHKKREDDAKEEHHATYEKANSPLIELHWGLAKSYIVQKVDMQGVWERAQAVSIAGCPALTLCPEDLVIYLCLHSARHVISFTLQMLVDIGEIVRKWDGAIDWKKLTERARQWDLHRAVYTILYLSKDLLGATVPRRVLEDLYPSDYDADGIAFMRNRLMDYRKPISQKPLNLKDSWDLITKLVAVSKENISLVYQVPVESKKIWCYFPRYWLRALRHRGRGLKKYLSNDASLKTYDDRIRLESYAVQNWLLKGRSSRINIDSVDASQSKIEE